MAALGLRCCTWASSLVAASGATRRCGAQASHCGGFSLWNTGSRCAGSVVVAHGLSCSSACGIFPDQGLHPCPRHWQADSFFFFSWLLKKFYFILFTYLWLCWVFVSVRGPSLVAASGGHCSSRCTGLSLSRPLLLRNTGSRRAGSVIVAHGPSCSAACGILPDQGLNLCPLHWQAGSQPLRHQGSPAGGFLTTAPSGKPLFGLLNVTYGIRIDSCPFNLLIPLSCCFWAMYECIHTR